jgi:hypothetical protein
MQTSRISRSPKAVPAKPVATVRPTVPIIE